LIKNVRLTYGRHMMGDTPQETIRLLLRQQCKEASQDTGGIGVKNGGVVTKGKTAHGSSSIVANSRQSG
jgi:hypothetical protein